MSKNTPAMALPSMLSFERKLEASDGLMFAGNWNDKNQQEKWKAIPIVKRQNRSTQSANGIDDVKKTAPNPVSSDSDDTNLPIVDKDTLKLSFTLRVIGNLGEPFACNKPDFGRAIVERVKEFKESESIHDLAFRYAYNIANGRFLWRNRVGAEEAEIQVRLHNEETSLTFNAYDFSLKDFDKNKENESLKKVAEAIRKGLAGDDDSSFFFMKVDAFVKLGEGQHVFPSQEMNMGEKKKKLFQLDGTAAMHNVKIGNAIRTIDTWYGDTMLIKAEDKGKTETFAVDARVPIAVEPYGSVTQHGRAYRPSKNDLYTLMKSWVNGGAIEADQQKYVVANLIRGGVFGGDSEG
jgi:CRISPR-associated protein Csy3